MACRVPAMGGGGANQRTCAGGCSAAGERGSPCSCSLATRGCSLSVRHPAPWEVGARAVGGPEHTGSGGVSSGGVSGGGAVAGCLGARRCRVRTWSAAAAGGGQQQQRHEAGARKEAGGELRHWARRLAGAGGPHGFEITSASDQPRRARRQLLSPARRPARWSSAAGLLGRSERAMPRDRMVRNHGRRRQHCLIAACCRRCGMPPFDRSSSPLMSPGVAPNHESNSSVSMSWSVRKQGE